MKQFFENYTALLAKVDRFCRDVETNYGSAVSCRKGCDMCCRHLSLFPVEAVFIRFTMENVDEPISTLIHKNAHDRIEDPDGPCPLLDKGACLLYQARPIICRTHGLPVLVEGDGGLRVDHCPLNFRDGKRLEKRYVINLEQLNKTLAAINRVFCDQVLEGAGVPDRLLLAEALLMDISG